MPVTLDQQGLVLDDRNLPLVSGSVHYWRHSAKDWPLILDRMKDLGLRMICTYIPWSVHEAGRGTFDFGELDPSKKVGRFIDLAHQRGLKVLVRPGPHINAELTYFGFPPRLFEDPIFLARNSRGGLAYLPVPPRAFPVISYASEAFWSELEGWFDAAAGIIRPRLHPNGPIVGVQLDNELSYFFRTSAYDIDYHPDALARWREFVAEKYGGEYEAGEAYGVRTSASELPPPDDFTAREPHQVPFFLDWVEFKEALLTDTLARLRDMWRKRQVDDVVFFHNFPISEVSTPLNLPEAERYVDYCGVDFYPHKHEYASLRRKLLFLAGQSRFPVSPEFASGCYPVWPPIDLHDQEFTTKVAWMFGLRGINFYMIVERERWYGSPITRTGAKRRDYWDFYQSHLQLLDRLRPWELRRKAPVCILSARDYERFEAAATAVAPLPPLALGASVQHEDLCYEHDCGFSRPVQALHAKMMRGWEFALTKMGIPYVIGSTDLSADRLLEFETVICPTFEFLGQRAQQTLSDYVTAGGKLVCGPEIPTLDASMRDFSTLMTFAARPAERLDCETDVLVCPAVEGEITLVTDVPLPIDLLQPIAEVVAERLGWKPVYPATGPCETSLHVGAGRRVLYVANPTAAPQRPQITLPRPGESLLDLETGHRFWGDTAVEIDLQPYSVRILEVRL